MCLALANMNCRGSSCKLHGWFDSCTTVAGSKPGRCCAEVMMFFCVWWFTSFHSVRGDCSLLQSWHPWGWAQPVVALPPAPPGFGASVSYRGAVILESPKARTGEVPAAGWSSGTMFYPYGKNTWVTVRSRHCSSLSFFPRTLLVVLVNLYALWLWGKLGVNSSTNPQCTEWCRLYGAWGK